MQASHSPGRATAETHDSVCGDGLSTGTAYLSMTYGTINGLPAKKLALAADKCVFPVIIVFALGCNPKRVNLPGDINWLFIACPSVRQETQG